MCVIGCVGESGLHVLVVDDEASILVTAKLVGRLFGWTITTTTSPREAVLLAKQLRPDVILSDYMMPECTGAELVVILKGNAETNHIPIVLMSGNADVPHSAANAFVEKPFAIATLRKVVEGAASNRGCVSK